VSFPFTSQKNKRTAFGVAGIAVYRAINFFVICGFEYDLSALRHLTSLRSLYLTDVLVLKDTELLRGLVDLEELHLSGCQSLSDLKGLYGLKKLTSVDLRNCLMVSTKSVTELRSALPNAKIQFPSEPPFGAAVPLTFERRRTQAYRSCDPCNWHSCS
jgi:hypothetical protein